MPSSSSPSCSSPAAAALTSRTAAARRHHHHHTDDDYEAVFERQEADRVEALPGQPSEVGFRHFSGYVTVNQTHGRALFYWFLEATHSVHKKPVVLWLNGGPGCSSLGTGAIQELGTLLDPKPWNKSPRAPTRNHGTERRICSSWNPLPVLASLTPTPPRISKSSATSSPPHDAYTFLVEWFKRFPAVSSTMIFYITGESYAGHYVPQLAEKILEMNKKYAWDHAVISDELHDAIATHCDFSRNDAASDFSSDAAASQQSDACDRAMDAFYEAFDDIDIYSLYTPVCTNSSSSSSSRRGGGAVAMPKNMRRRRRYVYGDYDPCLDQYAISYLNRGDVQRALHANVTGSIPLQLGALQRRAVPAMGRTRRRPPLPAIRRLADAGLRVWVYSGDTDARVPVTSTRYALRKLGLASVEPWREWFTSDQVGGYTVAYDGLTFITVRGAGHMVPTVKPVQASQLLAHFLAGKDLPRTPPAIVTEGDS
uniref:Carboxypeptidase n=1 Tax=Saccharum hybrid cultivar R570 TaxID=131158 RepID=A0A059Q2W1_9POAL|nr:serine carboxypeptidase-like protein [Saccharum hybrid cultivar R570]